MNVATSGNNDLVKRNFWRRGLLGGLAMTLGLIAAAPSCSAIVDTSAEQCNTTISCGTGKKCVDALCVDDIKDLDACATTDECAANKGDFYYCRKATGSEAGKCVALKSTLCDNVIGNYKATDPFFFGSIHPTRAPSAGDADVGIAMEESIKLALSELQKSAKGLPIPNDTARREVVLITCSDNAESKDSITAAKHLVDDVGVQAIIGGAFSGIAIDTATQVTIPGKALFISASGTSPAITDLSDKPAGAKNGLVWRTVPSDNFQANAVAEYMKVVEASVRTELGLMPAQPIKVAILHTSDAYGKGLRDALQPNLSFNGKSALDNGSNYIVAEYDDLSMDPPLTYYTEAKNKAIMAGAHVIFLFGFSEAVNEVFAKIEIDWTAPTHRPRYVFSDAVYGATLAAAVNAEPDPVKRADWRRRTTGVIPGPSDKDALYKGFLISYASGMRPGDPTIFGAASAYDAAYLLFFSAATITSGPITGVKLAEGMGKLSKADPVDAVVKVGASELPGALNKLSAGTYKSIDYNGAFGPLNFDATTGEPAANVQIYCLADDAGKAKSQLSGAFYNADTKMLENTASIDATCK